jgi:hypothetical protein
LLNRSHRQEFRIAALAVLALFIAQFGALAHAYSHHPADAAAAAAKAAADRQTPSSQEYCGECLNFAPLLSAGGTPAELPVSLQLTQSPPPPAPPASFLDHHAYLAFRSRAPPATR